jgi:hypothetical protein
MPGLDPGIQNLDRRVKPGDDMCDFGIGVFLIAAFVTYV